MITNTTKSRSEKIGVDEEKTQLQLRTMHDQNCVGSAIMNDLVTPNMEENNPVKTITISLQIEGEGVLFEGLTYMYHYRTSSLKW